MSLPKLRNLSKYGVITDLDPYDLPIEAFSLAVNCRFRNGRIVSAPVFRSVENLGQLDPRFLASATPTSGLDLLMIGYKSGRVYRYSSGTETNYSIASYADTPSEGTWTTCHNADVFYINREDRVPWSLRVVDSQFQALANWDPTWTCKILRSYNSALIALNVTKGATQTQTMVKTSSFAQAGTVPASWDNSVPSTSATENILAEMEGPITDASNFGNALCIYSIDQTWVMQASGAASVYNYTKLPFQKGALNANCSIQIDGKQIVFGQDDIWTHDGVSEQSICEGRTREFIFSSINMAKANRCFITHNKQYGDLHFCYVSGDRLVQANGEGCNRQAVWNYVHNTWTFDDLPLVFSAARANLDSTATYTTTTSIYSTVGGTYQDQEDTAKRVLCYVGDTNAAASLTKSLYAFDPYGVGSVVAFPVDMNATKFFYAEKDGLDLDELDADLQGYKQMNCIIPEGRIDQTSTATIDFQFGANDGFNMIPPIFAPWSSWNGADLYKCDFGDAGRYLSMRVRFNDFKTFSLSGLDLDFQIIGDR
jgi:hypothetical protein